MKKTRKKAENTDIRTELFGTASPRDEAKAVEVEAKAEAEAEATEAAEPQQDPGNGPATSESDTKASKDMTEDDYKKLSELLARNALTEQAKAATEAARAAEPKAAESEAEESEAAESEDDDVEDLDIEVDDNDDTFDDDGIADLLNNYYEDDDDDEPVLTADIPSLLKIYDADYLNAAVAQLVATDGKVVNDQLFDIIMLAVKNNADIRAAIVEEIPDLILDYPYIIEDVQDAIEDACLNNNLRYMVKCGYNGKHYQSEDAALEELDKAAILALYRGEWEFQPSWLEIQQNGDLIIEITKEQVEAKVNKMPVSVQKQVRKELHLTEPANGQAPEA